LSGASFAERFAGQTNTPSGGLEVLSRTPTASLSLAVSATNQNLNVFINAGSQVLTGLGPSGFQDFDAIGEGSFAILFSTDQSEFGFQLVGGNGGSATIDFFLRDGLLIDHLVVGGLADAFYGFSREGGTFDIAGISIFNDDAAGIGFDNLKLKHDVKSEGTVPEPGTVLLVGAALASLAGRRRFFPS